MPVNGRLDQQRYKYVNWTPNPLAKYPESLDAAFTELARRFFRWVGPATLGEFQWFAGLGVKTTKQAVESLGLVPAEPGSDRLLLPDDVAAFRKFEAPTTPQYSLVSSLDPITANRREMQSLIDDKDRERTVMVDAASKPVGGLADLPSHAILDRGQIVGLWEFDVGRGRDRVGDVRAQEGQGARRRRSRRREAFVRDQLGDARSFSLDSPKSRVARLESLRKMRARGLDHRAAGPVEIFRRVARALGFGGFRSRTFEPTGTRLRVRTWLGPRCLSLLARRRLRRAPAPDGNAFDQDDCSLATRDLGSARAARAGYAASRTAEAAGARTLGARARCSLLTVRSCVQEAGVARRRRRRVSSERQRGRATVSTRSRVPVGSSVRERKPPESRYPADEATMPTVRPAQQMPTVNSSKQQRLTTRQRTPPRARRAGGGWFTTSQYSAIRSTAR